MSSAVQYAVVGTGSIVGADDAIPHGGGPGGELSRI